MHKILLGYRAFVKHWTIEQILGFFEVELGFSTRTLNANMRTVAF